MPLIPENVIGVLVTYQPDAAVAARIEAHLQQLSHIVVIDNGVQAPSALLPKSENITLLAHPNNNLAAAQNAGIAAARARSARAVLLLDDDSDLSEGALAAMCGAYCEGDGLIAPALFEQGRESKQAQPWLYVGFRRRCAPLQNSFTPIASGSLIPLAVIDQVGLMDESFGIDYIDRDFCLRLLQRGLNVRVIAGARLTHRIGLTHLSGAVKVRGHSPARRRSIFRNRLRCWARYGLCFPSFLLYDVLAAGYDIARIAAYEEQKRAKLGAIVEGVIDALCRRNPA